MDHRQGEDGQENGTGRDAAHDAARADVWLWRARFFKSRALAARFVRDERLRVARGGETRRLRRPSATLRPGDVLTFARGGRSVCVRVLEPGLRRGPAGEAAGLYETLDGGAEDERQPGERGAA